MSVDQVMLCWVLMMIQGARRLQECFVFSKPSSSDMWFVHWLLGIAFYLAAGIAIWIEGAGMRHSLVPFIQLTFVGSLLSHRLSLEDINIANAPSLRTFICVPIFLLASGLQHDCHHYLFSLEKYSVPTHPVFANIISPHYMSECLIYLSLAAVAAPKGEAINKTLGSCLCFVAVNLGISASTSKQWYRAKFGESAVEGKWKMIPWVY